MFDKTPHPSFAAQMPPSHQGEGKRKKASLSGGF
jgi:hypothetical protein